MKRTAVWLLALSFLAGVVAVPSFAQDAPKQEKKRRKARRKHKKKN
jgi:hypothetical protein